MPLYEYQCAQCGEKTEILVRSGDRAQDAPRCPNCGGPMARNWAPVAAHTKSPGGGSCAPRGGFT
ncbi:FmdB family zinc ribbon protein [Deferrisoma sp.]